MSFLEKNYGKAFRSVLWAVNPVKKKIIRTECQVHRFINYKAAKILNKFDYNEEFEIINLYLEDLNRGVVWADQDFKSINHFYNPGRKKGLYGHSNALKLATSYYEKAIKYWKEDSLEDSMFYLGACVHILQDMTIPQHVNIRLLDSHRKYENYVKMTYDIVADYTAYKKPIELTELEHFIRFNSKQAIEIYDESRDIEDERERFHNITTCALPIAQRTTAGCFLMFLKDVNFEGTIN